MIRRDKNRANVIIWSIANETPHSAERDERKASQSTGPTLSSSISPDTMRPPPMRRPSIIP
jgi:beta-galactosidase/beta-glucuronidase